MLGVWIHVQISSLSVARTEQERILPHDVDCTFPTCHLSPATVAGRYRIVLYCGVCGRSPWTRSVLTAGLPCISGLEGQTSSLCLLVCEQKSRTTEEEWGKGVRGMAMLERAGARHSKEAS